MFTNIIIRKPKFMRNDSGMLTYIKVAETISIQANRPELTSEQRVELLKECGKCLNSAARAGGFRNISDMAKWFAKQKRKLTT